METLIDLGIIIFIPLMVIRGYFRGGILSICSFFTVFVAFMGATLISNNFCEPVGRLVQPVIKTAIMDVLETRLAYENIIIEKPTENVETEEEGESAWNAPEYLSMTRAIQILEGDYSLEKIHGFLDVARDTLLYNSGQYVGSVTDVISTVLGREIARVGIFVVSFILTMAVWLLFSRILAKIFKFPGLAEINAIVGAGMGFFMGVLLVSVFAWATGGGIIPYEGVERTIIYEFFVKYSILDSLALASSINLDL